MKCIQEPYKVYGDYNAAEAANLQAVFVKCDPGKRDDCKSQSEIDQWLEFKYFVMLENQQSYNHPVDDPSNRIIENSFFRWLPFDTKVRIDYVMKVQMQEVSYDKFPYGIGIGKSQETVFSIQQTLSRVLPYTGDKRFFHQAVTFEYDSSVEKITRLDYGFL